MKKAILLLLSCVCIGIHADEFTLTLQAPSNAIVGQKFSITYSSNAKQCHSFNFDGINNTLPNELGGLRVVASPAYSDVRSMIVDSEHPVIRYRWTLLADKEGTYTIPAASITVNGKKLVANSITITVKAEGEEAPKAPAKEENSSQTNVTKKLKVESFELLDTDLTAVTQGTMEHDTDGNIAALIKVKADDEGYSFDVGSLGVIRTVKKEGEIWVYVPSGVENISIIHPQKGVVRNYAFGIPVRGARTYGLVLATATESAINANTSNVAATPTPTESTPQETEKSPKGNGFSLWKGIKTFRDRRGGKEYLEYRFQELPVAASKKQIVINDYETDYQFRDGMLAVCNNDLSKWGFYDEDGNLLPGGFKWSKPFTMGKEFSFGSDHCIVFEHIQSESGFHNFICYIIDKQGKTKRLPAGDNASTVWPFNNGGIAAMETKGSGVYVTFFNTKGEQVLKGIHAEEDTAPIGDFIDGWAKLYAGYRGQQKGYTFVNKNGKTIGKYYKQAQDFSEGLAAVYVETPNGDRWGFIDTSGNMVIEPRFSFEPTPFSCGYTVATKQNGNKVYIDRQGNVCGQEAKWYTCFVNGKAFAAGEHPETWMIDTDMNRHEISTQGYNCVSYDDIHYLSEFPPIRTVLDNQYIVSHGGPYSSYNEHTLIDPNTGIKYSMGGFGHNYSGSIDHISPRRIHVSWTDENRNEREGFINELGELCLEFVKDEF